MAESTNIEWCDATFNPWIGCTKVSTAKTGGGGCDHCYAEVSTPSRALGVVWGAGQPRRRTSPGNWAMSLRWDAQATAFAAQHGRRQRVFCASLADVFDNEVPDEWRADLFALIEATPNLDWLLLTKRIGNVRKMVPAAWLAKGCWPKHARLGITICNQQEADRDVVKLIELGCPNLLSIEPLLGTINLRNLPCGEGEIDALKPDTWEVAIEQWRDTDEAWIEQFEDWYSVNLSDGLSGPMHSGIDWVIVGGESGTNARPMHPDWARSLRDQCAAAGVPFLFKQWGEWTPGENVERVRGTVDTAFLHGDEWHIHPLNLTTDHGHIDDQPDLYRVGKKAAGRLLDGCTWDEVPR